MIQHWSVGYVVNDSVITSSVSTLLTKLKFSTQETRRNIAWLSVLYWIYSGHVRISLSSYINTPMRNRFSIPYSSINAQNLFFLSLSNKTAEWSAPTFVPQLTRVICSPDLELFRTDFTLSVSWQPTSSSLSFNHPHFQKVFKIQNAAFYQTPHFVAPYQGLHCLPPTQQF